MFGPLKWEEDMQYQYEATSLVGFIQQLAVGYVRHGYYFFVQGRVPEGKDPKATDRKLLDRYGIAMSKGERYRRKLRGEANLQYIRFGREWVMLATPGEHSWVAHEQRNICDLRRQPLVVLGYSISVAKGGYLRKREGEEEPQFDGRLRVRVQIARENYRELEAELLGLARQRRADWIADRFWNIGYEPYAPIRKQLLELLRRVNKARRSQGLPTVATSVIRYHREPVKPFAAATESGYPGVRRARLRRNRDTGVFGAVPNGRGGTHPEGHGPRASTVLEA